MIVRLFSCATIVVAAACSDGPKRSPNGDTCELSNECASGLCMADRCVDPAGDEDADGVINRLEASLTTDPNVADSDGDGKSDRDELTDTFEHIDSDKDGKPDALESATADADGDCKPDERDPDDATDTTSAAAEICGALGVCADAQGGLICDGEELACDFSAIADWAETDGCDGLDNDCDGETDEDTAWNECYPVDCQDLFWRDPFDAGANGVQTLDPGGPGGTGPVEVECEQTLDGRGWTRLSGAFLAEMHHAATYDYLFVGVDGWYRSAPSPRWDWTAGAWAAEGDVWYYGRSETVEGQVSCTGATPRDIVGVGCDAGDGAVYIADDATVDADDGTTTLCLGSTDPTEADCYEVAVYVRHRYCVADEGSMMGRGGFSGDTLDDTRDCWNHIQPEGADYIAWSQDAVSTEDAPALSFAATASEALEVWEVRTVQSNVTLLNDHAYRVRFKARGDGSSRMEAGFASWTEGDAYAHFQDVIPPTAWTQYEIGFVPRDSASRFDAIFHAGGASGELLLDDVVLEDLGPASCEPVGGNLIANGDFDLSTACWNLLNNEPLTGAGFDIHTEGEGGPAVRFTLGAETSDVTNTVLRQIGIPLQAARTYALSFIATSPDGPRSGVIQLFADDYSADFAYADWATGEFSTIFTIPEGDVPEGFTLEIKMGGNPAGAILFDDIEIRELTPR